MSRRQLTGALLGTLVAFASDPIGGAGRRPIPIEEFQTESSDQQAGGHPDLVTEFKLGESRNTGGEKRHLRSSGGDLRQPERGHAAARPRTSPAANVRSTLRSG